MDRAIPSYFTPLIDPEQLDERYSNVAGRLFLDCRIQRRYCTSHLQTGIARLVRPGAKKSVIAPQPVFLATDINSI